MSQFGADLVFEKFPLGHCAQFAPTNVAMRSHNLSLSGLAVFWLIFWFIFLAPLDVPLTHRLVATVGLFEKSSSVPVEGCGEASIEEAVVVDIGCSIDERGAGSVVVVRIVLTLRHGWGGKLVALHFLLFVLGYVNTSADLEDYDNREEHEDEGSEDDSDDHHHGAGHPPQRLLILTLCPLVAFHGVEVLWLRGDVVLLAEALLTNRLVGLGGVGDGDFLPMFAIAIQDVVRSCAITFPNIIFDCSCGSGD